MTDTQDKLVYTVWVSSDETTHIFSTEEKAMAFSGEQQSSCVLSTYMIDNPDRFYERTN